MDGAHGSAGGASRFFSPSHQTFNHPLAYLPPRPLTLSTHPSPSQLQDLVVRDVDSDLLGIRLARRGAEREVLAAEEAEEQVAPVCRVRGGDVELTVPGNGVR